MRVPAPLPRLLALSLLLAALAGCQSAYFAALNLRRPVAMETRSLGPAPHQRIDVFRPAPATQPAPVVVFFYGGRWQGGRRADYRFVGQALAGRGVVALVADYRHYPQVRFPEFVHDAAAAVAWAHRNAAALGGDPRRVHVAGHSAGAHLAALLATDARYLRAQGLQPRDLAGAIGIAGPYDFLPLTDADLVAVFGAEPGWRESQPVEFVDGDEPAFLLLHGADDRMVWPRNSERLAARLRGAGVPVEHRVYPGLGHVRILSAFRFAGLAPTLQDVADFVHAKTARGAP